MFTTSSAFRLVHRLALLCLLACASRAEFAVSGRQILKDGVPFVSKGVCYNPTPIGGSGQLPPYGDYYTNEFSSLWARDLPNLRAMGANVVRVYNWDCEADHRAFLDQCYNGGDRPIYVLITFWVWPASNWSDPATTRDVLAPKLQSLERGLQNHPAVLGITLGNEVNTYYENGYNADFWRTLDQTAAAIKAVNPKRLVTTTTTDRLDHVAFGDRLTPNLDLWCMQLYRGASFGSFFNDYAGISSRPVLITEYGFDAFDVRTMSQFPNDAEYSADVLAGLWGEIVRAGSICAGGCVFEYADEWIRAPGGTDNVQNPGGWYTNSFIDGSADEEYFGLFSISKTDGLDRLTPRAAYEMFSALWNPAPPSGGTDTTGNNNAIGGGDFEAPAISSGNFFSFLYNPVVANWTFAGNAGVTGNGSGFTSANASAPSGSQVAFVQMRGSLLTQVKVSAGTYRVSGKCANRGNWGGRQTVAVYVDGTVVGQLSGGSAYQDFTTDAISLTAGTHEIRFQGLSDSDATLLIDNLRLVANSPVIEDSFEAPSVGMNAYSAYAYANTVNAAVQPWVFSGNAGVAGNGSGFTSANPNAPAGTQVAFLQTQNSSVARSVTFAATGTHELTFAAAQRGNYNEANQQISIALDGVPLGSVSPSSTAYQTFSIAFTATAGTHTLTLRGMTPGDSTAFVDQLAIVQR